MQVRVDETRQQQPTAAVVGWEAAVGGQVPAYRGDDAVLYPERVVVRELFAVEDTYIVDQEGAFGQR